MVGEKAFDSFVAEEALEAILAAEVGEDRTEAVQVLRGDETTWPRVLDAARTRSLFAERRAVVVRGADALKGEPEGLEGYLGDPTPGVTLVLMAAKVDRRKSAWKRILETAQVHKADPPKGLALRGLVTAQLRRRKLTLTEDAVAELLERVGQDLRRLMGELDKLEAFGEGQGQLSAEAVTAVLGKGLAQPLYKMGDAMVAREPEEVLALVDGLLDEGEEAVRVLGALHRSVRQVRRLVALREARASRDEMLSRLNLPGNMAFKLPSLLDASKRWSETELRTALLALDRADRRIKTGTNPRVALGAAVAEACGRGATSPRPGR